MLKELIINPEDKVLIVAPHPDDECIGAGGILAKYPKNCTVAVCTNGGNYPGDGTMDKKIKIRYSEFWEEMKFAGVNNFIWLNYEDGCLKPEVDFLKHVNLRNYDYIFVTHAHDGHPDHAAAFAIIKKQLMEHPEIQGRLFTYEVHKQMQNITHFLNITEYIEKKNQLIKFHNSQLQNTCYDKMVVLNGELRALQQNMQDSVIEVFCEETKECGKDESIYGEYVEKYQKQLEFYRIYDAWSSKLINSEYISMSLINRGYHEIAIYGFAELGRLLLKDAEKVGLCVRYVMDKQKKGRVNEEIPIVYPQEGLMKVDAIVVTAITYFESIENELKSLGYSNVISLKELIHGF